MSSCRTQNSSSPHCGHIIKKVDDKKAQSQIAWCLRQKRGIKKEEPNDNLYRAYLRKAKGALNMLSVAVEKSEIEWIATTAYYARYFALYALLQKCGIKSEIHTCTLSLVNVLFVKEEVLKEKVYTELKRAKEMRGQMQYYTTEGSDLQQIKNDAEKARDFVLKMEEAGEKITEEQVREIRTKIFKYVPKTQKE